MKMGGVDSMMIENYFPMWQKMTGPQQDQLRSAAFEKEFPKGTVVHK